MKIKRIIPVFLSLSLLTSCNPDLNKQRTELLDSTLTEAIKLENEKISAYITNGSRGMSDVSKFEITYKDQSEIKDVHLIEDGEFDYHTYPGIYYFFDITYESSSIKLIKTRLVEISSIVQYDENLGYYFILAYCGDDDFDHFDSRFDVRLTYDQTEFKITNADDPTVLLDLTYSPDSYNSFL